MRTLLSIAVLIATALPVFAGPIGGNPNAVPEPESLALLAIAAVALVVARRTKK